MWVKMGSSFPIFRGENFKNNWNPRPSCYCRPFFKIYKSLCFPDLLPHKGSGAIMGCHEICRDLKFLSLVRWFKKTMATGSDWKFVGEYILSITMKKFLTCGKCSFWGLESLLQITIIMITRASPIEGLAIGPSFSCLRKAGSWETWCQHKLLDEFGGVLHTQRPLKSYRNPIGKACLPTSKPPFFKGYVC